jgi:uncharacterized protein (TIGR00297 family)
MNLPQTSEQTTNRPVRREHSSATQEWGTVAVAIALLAALYHSGPHGPAPDWRLPAAVSLAFAAAARALRGVTTRGAIAGAVVAFAMLSWQRQVFWELLLLFAITWVTTRLGRERKLRLGVAESRGGRDALQVLANIGAAGLFVVPFIADSIAAAAVLAEAAADTVASEIGQAYGGTPRMLTTWREARVGADGAITWIGTLAGLTAALCLAITIARSSRALAAIMIGATVGLFCDSLLGATLEPRLLRNNGVNFISTIIAGLSAAAINAM